eukprot:scaffold215086_cov25-Prasinocladus_malaysianus.AAC.3
MYEHLRDVFDYSAEAVAALVACTDCLARADIPHEIIVFLASFDLLPLDKTPSDILEANRAIAEATDVPYTPPTRPNGIPSVLARLLGAALVHKHKDVLILEVGPD